MSNIPTAEEFLRQEFNIPEYAHDISEYLTRNDIYKGMIEFAKLHVEEALKQVVKKAKIEMTEGTKEVFIGWGAGRSPAYGKETITKVKEESIIKAYPLTNIK